MGLLDVTLTGSKTPALAVKTGAPKNIAGHWTMDELHLDLLDEKRSILQSRKGPGFRAASASMEKSLAAVISDWDQNYGSLPVTLSGLAGSLLGRHKIAPTLCPIDVRELPATAVACSFDRRLVHLVPGLTCLSRTGAPDYLWGEETILAGAAAMLPDLLHGAKVVCIPGSCTRWIVLRYGRVLHFTTSLPTEIFRILGADPFLCGNGNGEIQPDVFAKGIREAAEFSSVDLLHLLPQARCRALDGEIAPADAPSFILGLLIGRDVAAADTLLKFNKRSSIMLIAENTESYLYAQAFEFHHLRVTHIDASRAISAGLSAMVAARASVDGAAKVAGSVVSV